MEETSKFGMHPSETRKEKKEGNLKSFITQNLEMRRISP